jgi:hypothetical protein
LTETLLHRYASRKKKGEKMKRYLLASLCLFLVNQLAPADVPMRDGVPIDIVKDRFLQSGTPIIGSTMDMFLLYYHPECLPEIKSAVSFSAAARITLGTGLFFTGSGLICVMVATGIMGESPEGALPLAWVSLGLGLAGLALDIIAWPLNTISQDNYEKAIAKYNKNLKKKKTGLHIEVSPEGGIGLLCTFVVE